MAMFAVKSTGFTESGEPQITMVNADKFETDDDFVVFKTGSVVVKAIRNWQVDSVELMNPPQSTTGEETTEE